MALFKRNKHKAFDSIVIDNIVCMDDHPYSIVYMFPRKNGVIKHGAKLFVHKNQVAILFSQGQFADLYQPGHYELVISNMPILTKIKGWKYDFISPFEADVYFINTQQFPDQRWASTVPIMIHDPEFGPIRVSACGTYSFKVKPNPIIFIRNVAGIKNNFSDSSITEKLHSFVIEKFSDYLTESRIAILDLATNLLEFSSELSIALKDDFSEYGIELSNLLIQSISIPDIVEEALDNYNNMEIASHMNTSKIKTSNQSSADRTQSRQQNIPPPLPQDRIYYVAIGNVQQGPLTMTQLQQMQQQGQLTPNTLVWTAGMAGWTAANIAPLLAELFGNTASSL